MKLKIVLLFCFALNLINAQNLDSDENKHLIKNKKNMHTHKIVIPIPSYGFDPTEVAIPWKQLVLQNFEVIFATPNGQKAAVDSIMVNGKKLGFWKFVLRARKDAVQTYSELEQAKSFCNPLKYDDLRESDFDAILLPGGHDKGVIEYLESKSLQNLIVDFFNAKKTVAAICHGVVLVSRSIDPITKKSVIYDYKTTSLLKSQELLAYNMTKKRLKDYYLTYPGLTVEDEVKSSLRDSTDYLQGKKPILRDNEKRLKRGFTVRDRNYLSARWPGDSYSFSKEFIKMVKDYKNQ